MCIFPNGRHLIHQRCTKSVDAEVFCSSRDLITIHHFFSLHYFVSISPIQGRIVEQARKLSDTETEDSTAGEQAMRKEFEQLLTVLTNPRGMGQEEIT